MKFKVEIPKSEDGSPKSEVRRPKSEDGSSKFTTINSPLERG
jgi:hypothetical protein